MKLRNKEKGLFLEIAESLVEKICLYGFSHYPKEFGGLLIGRYTNDGRTVVICEIVLPEDYKSSKFSFQRGNRGLKKKLEMLYKKTPSLIYVGEWHTHPDNAAVPSVTDMKALEEIVQDERVFINNPILLILSIGKEKCETVFYVYIKNRVYRYEKEKEQG